MLILKKKRKEMKFLSKKKSQELFFTKKHVLITLLEFRGTQ